VSDLPIPLLFRELDKGYPGSKFILTTRRPQAWLESVRRHWSHEYNPHRAQWGTDPFTHRAHRILYGQKGFDAERFLKRYQQHNLEVKAYFASRPNDLLILDMEDKASLWHRLCDFLGCLAPNVPYPNEFVTRSQPDYQI
jgi:hypothetical protein